MILKKTLGEYLIILGLFETAEVMDKHPYFDYTFDEIERIRIIYYDLKIAKRTWP